MLEYDRCQEEERRLIHESISLQHWMLEEWTVLKSAMLISVNDQDIYYQLQLHWKKLLNLCVTWESMIRVIPGYQKELWGPSAEEMNAARAQGMTESVIESKLEDEDDEDDNHEFNNAALLDAVETSALADQFHFDLNQDRSTVSFRGFSPEKRGRQM